MIEALLGLLRAALLVVIPTATLSAAPLYQVACPGTLPGRNGGDGAVYSARVSVGGDALLYVTPMGDRTDPVPTQFLNPSTDLIDLLSDSPGP